MQKVFLAWTHAIHRITERKLLKLTALFFVVVVAVGLYISIYAGSASAAANTTINFQARVLTNTGGVVGDGFYTVAFNLYSSSTGGTSQWTETQVITSKNGYITVSLGSVTPFGSNIDWSQEQWLSMNINGDGEMNPRMKVTAVPLAFRAVQADSLTTSSGTVNANQLTQLSPLAVQDTNSGSAAVRINQLGSGGLLQLQAGGSDVFSVDNGGNVAAAGGLRVGNSSSAVAGTIRWTGTAFEGYDGTQWAPLGSGLAVSAGATASFVSGLQNVAANATGAVVEAMVFTSATAVSNTAGVTGFTAPANGSFRTCLVKNNAAITAGTLGVRWRVNGVSVGSSACNMDATTNRQSSSVLNGGVVTFNAGDTIGIAFDTSTGFLPAGSNDFTVYWSVEYAGNPGATIATGSLQDVYDNSLVASILTSNSKDIKFDLADTTIDSNFLVNIASGSTAKFAVQNNGSDIFRVGNLGDVMAARGVTLGMSGSTTAGTIRWTGADFEGYDGIQWKSLTQGSGTGGGSSELGIHKVKMTDETVNNSATFQNDDELTFPIGANENYTFRFVVNGNSATAPDFKFAVTAPSGATCAYGYQDVETAVSLAGLGCGVTTGLVTGNGTADVYEIVGSVRNGSTAGAVTLQWAQNTATASNTIVYAGSFVDAFRAIGPGDSGQPFVQGGNSFGATAVLGTNDTNDLALVTNGLQRVTVAASGNVGIGDTTPSALFTVGTNDALQVNAAGNVLTSGTLSVGGLTTLSDSLVGNRSATATASTTVATGTNTTTLTAATDVFNVNDVVLIDNVGQDYYTRITSDAGTGTYTVSPAVTFESGRTITKYTVQNIGATAADYTSATNRFFQGYFLGGLVVGAGSTTISDGAITSTTTLTLQATGGDVALGGGLVVAGTISGDGSGLTNINGAQIVASSISDSSLSANVTLAGNAFNGANQLLRLDASGKVADSLLSTTITTQGNTFNGANQLVQLTATSALPAVNGAALTGITAANITSGGTLPTLNGSGLTSLNASNITSGTLDVARLPGSVTLAGNTFNGANQLVQLNASGKVADSLLNTTITAQGNTFNGNNQLVQLTGTGTLPALNGSGLTALNASNISTGTLADGRLSGNVTLLGNTFNGANQLLQLNASGKVADSLLNTTITAQGNTFNGANQLVRLDGSSALPTVSGAGLTSLNASNIDTGTLVDARLSANVTLLGNTFNGANQLVRLDGTGALPAVSGAGLTLLNATNVATGTLSDSRLSTNVGLLGTAQTYTAQQTFALNIVLGTDGTTPTAGALTLHDSVASNGFTSVLGTNTLTANRSITLPDTSGVLLVMGSATAQADATTNSSIFINKTGASGDILTLQKSGTSIVRMLNSGALQMTLTSTTAFSVKNAGGTDFFNVDTSGGLIRIGNPTADATGVLLVLDTKNTTGDPAGTNGGMYYNSADGKNRCYENGAWIDCTTMRLAGETTLAAANGTINVALNGNYEYLECHVDIKGRSAANIIYTRFNNVSTANAYGWNAYGIVAAAVTDWQGASDTEIQLSGTQTGTNPFSADLKITNYTDTNKVVDWTAAGLEAVGTNSNRYSGVGGYYNTTAQITSVQFIASTGTFTTGSHAWCQGKNVR